MSETLIEARVLSVIAEARKAPEPKATTLSGQPDKAKRVEQYAKVYSPAIYQKPAVTCTWRR